MNYWLFPCNTKYFDINTHFKNNEIVVFKQDKNMNIGDIVYIYLAVPYKKIQYKCEVIKTKINDEELLNHDYALTDSPYIKGYVKLKLLKNISSNKLDYYSLKEHGLGQIQRQGRLEGRLLKYVLDLENN